MNSVDYCICDPSGNITILVKSAVPASERARIAAEIMKKEPSAEQAGFLSSGDDSCDIRLDMAGGEFCANATLSAAACFRAANPSVRHVKVSVSGCESVLGVDIEEEEDGVYTGTVCLPPPAACSRKTFVCGAESFTFPVVDMGGIVHIVAPVSFGEKRAESVIRDWCRALGADALGIMLLDEKTMRLTPIVYVPGADTLFYESSCGSGSSAAGYYLALRAGAETVSDIVQPGGTLRIRTAPGENIYLTGNIKILKKNT